MRYAIISDVHANLEALEVVLGDIDRRRADALICLGDFVGYGPDPVACVERLRPGLAGGVVGNHDRAAVGTLDITDFNPLAQAAILWTREQLTAPVRAFLRDLPSQITPDGFLAVHGSVRDPVEEYIIDPRAARASFLAGSFRLCVVGHTHMPAIFTLDGDVVSVANFAADESLRLEPARRYIVNVGSVGQPRDGDRRAAYAWFDEAQQVITMMRLDYPVERTQKKMAEAGLPPMLAERLAHGR
ncbi:MAG TPA: metallophosphoesterase family protein [bacterium]|nr:metallophosphoesterase family protein [bacterium]